MSDKKFDQLLGKISAFFSADFHSKEGMFFFSRHEVPGIYICKDSDQMLLKRHCLDFSCSMLLGASGATLHSTKIA